MSYQNNFLFPELVQRMVALSHPLAPQPTGVAPKLLPLQSVRAVLFDIYGTLFVSGSGDIGTAQATDNDDAFWAALTALGLEGRVRKPTPAGSTLIETAIGAAHQRSREAGTEYPEVDITEIWRSVLAALSAELPPEDPDAASLIRRLAVEYECRVNPVWPMPGLREVLAAQRSAGRLLGIVSNAQFYTPLLFQAFLQSELKGLGFQPSLCAFSYQTREAKPSTRLFERVLAVLRSDYNLPPQQTLYVGNDMLKDIWPAARLGCKTALFAGDQRSLRLREDDPRCENVEPDLIITDLRQLVEL
jgi:putative hydrolase of the HAD superfamily